MAEEKKWSLKMVGMHVDSVPETLSRIRRIADHHNVWIVCMNAHMMAGREHAIASIEQAIRAEGEGRMIARSLEMEVLLYASGQRQTGQGMKFGLHEGEMSAWVAVIASSDEERRDRGGEEKAIKEAWGELFMITKEIPEEQGIPEERVPILQELFGISDAEISLVGSDRISELVIERTALLNILK